MCRLPTIREMTLLDDLKTFIMALALGVALMARHLGLNLSLS